MRLPVSFVTGVLVSTVLAKPYVVDTHKKISYQVFTSAPGVDKFLGIFYGKDASSKNRFAPPQAFNPPAGYIFNVNTVDADCPQASGGGFLYQTNVTNISENCLNLLPARSVQACNDTKIPVMVFIYEGGLNTGTAYDRTANPDCLVQKSVQNGFPVIYIAMNYSLCSLSVGMQLLAYGASKTAQFQAAIMQSTALEPGMVTNISFNATSVIAAAAGWIAIDAYSKSPALVECLRALSMETLLDLTNSFITETSSNNDGDIVLHTTDQDFLPKIASGFFASKKLPKIVYMTGWMENDVALSLIPQSPPQTIPAHFSSSATHTSIPPQ